MCGIVGYIGEKQASPILLKSLEKLEYRGYDSAGIAVYNNDEIEIIKDTKKISELKKDVAKKNLNSHIGIGHTRWATHGKPTVANAHPHASCDGRFAVVHNGIIENYIPFREKLIENGFTFRSDTDTEVFANLLSFYKNENPEKSFFEIVKMALRDIEGSYALEILCKDNPDELIVAKKNSPLIIGLCKGETVVASDVAAIISYTKEIVRLADGELAVIKKDGIKYFDSEFNEIQKCSEFVDWTINTAEKDGYEHFMIKEIMEQPKAVKATFCPRIVDNQIKIPHLDFSKCDIENIRKIWIVGCGSAFHVGCIAKYIFEKILRIPTDVEIASEFRYKDPIVTKDDIVIAISQSGETADTLAAVKEAKKFGAKVISIVNVIGSSIANESDIVIPTLAGPEIAVATTKAYSTQLIVIYMLTLYMAEKIEKISREDYQKLISELKDIPEKIENVLKDRDTIKAFGEKFSNCKNIFFIGRNVDYGIALEGALKTKEISYIHSEAYAAGELKHGTISLIEEGTLVVAIATKEDLIEKMISNIREVKARGAVVLMITTEDFEKAKEIADYILCIPKINEMMQPSLSIVPLQLFAYYIALSNNCEIDKPRNLAKSVTVE